MWTPKHTAGQLPKSCGSQARRCGASSCHCRKKSQGKMPRGDCVCAALQLQGAWCADTPPLQESQSKLDPSVRPTANKLQVSKAPLGPGSYLCCEYWELAEPGNQPALLSSQPLQVGSQTQMACGALACASLAAPGPIMSRHST